MLSTRTEAHRGSRSLTRYTLLIVIGQVVAFRNVSAAGLMTKCRTACATRATFECDQYLDPLHTPCAKQITRRCLKAANRTRKSQRLAAIGTFCAQVDLRDDWHFSEGLGGFSADVTVTSQSGNSIGGTAGVLRWSGSIQPNGGWAGETETSLIAGCLTSAQFVVYSLNSTSDATFTISYDCGSISNEDVHHGSMYRGFLE